jgi:UDP-3-O-[3-hydroxymyristoyl] N-acetylglucosamine deacetylase
MDDRFSRMYSRRNQQTIARPCSVAGFGYWSSRDIRVEFRPAEPNTGIVFVRADLPGCPRIPARVENRTDMPRRTNLRCGEASVDMVEHIMAALAGLQIDNCEVWVDAQEMPGCDGSSLAFVEALDAVGVVRQPAWRASFVARQSIRLGNEDSWIQLRPCCSGKAVLQYELDYPQHPAIGRQTLELVLTPGTFRSQVAPCRTFALKAEAEAIQRKGIGQRATCKDLLIFDDRGPIDNRLRFPDECVRHKLLDMIGDLALAGCDLVGRVSAYRSGHHLNAALVQSLLGAAQSLELKRCA